MKNIVRISYAGVILSYLIANLKDVHFSTGIPLLINSVILFIYLFILSKRKRNVNRNIRIILIFIFILFLIYPLLTINYSFLNNILNEIFGMMVFTVNIFLTSKFIVEEDEILKFLKITYLIMGIFLICMYIIHFDNFEGIKKLRYLFNNHLRYRYAFGFYYVNASGQICALVLILNSILRKLERRKIKLYEIIFNIVSLIILISSASRDSIITLILFYCMYYLISLKNKLENRYRNKYITAFINLLLVTIILSVILFIILLVSNNYINLDKIIQNTNRLGNFQNIQLLQYENRKWIGIGLIDPGLFMSIGTYVDGWFLYMFLTESIFGIVVFLGLLIFLTKKLVINNDRSREGTIVASVFIISVFYSIFETAFYNHNIILSYIFWIIYLVYLRRKNYN